MTEPTDEENEDFVDDEQAPEAPPADTDNPPEPQGDHS